VCEHEFERFDGRKACYTRSSVEDPLHIVACIVVLCLDRLYVAFGNA